MQCAVCNTAHKWPAGGGRVPRAGEAKTGRNSSVQWTLYSTQYTVYCTQCTDFSVEAAGAHCTLLHAAHQCTAQRAAMQCAVQCRAVQCRARMGMNGPCCLCYSAPCPLYFLTTSLFYRVLCLHGLAALSAVAVQTHRSTKQFSVDAYRSVYMHTSHVDRNGQNLRLL